MKSLVRLYWDKPRDKKLWVTYDEKICVNEKWFKIELTQAQIDILNLEETTLDQVHEILNRELYKQTWIVYGDKPKD